MLNLLLTPLRLAGRHLRLSIAIAVLTLAVGSAVGVYGYRRAQVNEARAAVERRDYPEARRHVRAALDIWSADAPLQLLAARIERLNGDYEEATKHLDECKRLQGGPSADTQDEWLLLRALNNELDEVAPQLLYAIAHDHPRKLEMLETLARACMREMRFRQAWTYLDQWLEFDPDNALALDWRSWVLKHLNFQDRALADAERGLQLQPDRHNLRLRLIDMLLDKKHMHEAAPHAEYAVAERPNDPDALVALARCRVLQAASAEARQLLERAIELYPEHPVALLELAKIYNREGRYADAERVARQGLNREPDHGELLFVLCESMRNQNKSEAEIAPFAARNDQIRADIKLTEEFLRTQAESPSRTADQAAAAGSALLRLHQDRLAVQWLQTALKQDPANRIAHLALADYLEKTGDANSARELRRTARAGRAAISAAVGCAGATFPSAGNK